jgi:hypothetical protein
MPLLVNQNPPNAHSASNHDKASDCHPGPSNIPARGRRICANFLSMRRQVITDGFEEF